jgi:phosphatidate phosphatase APP1
MKYYSIYCLLSLTTLLTISSCSDLDKHALVTPNTNASTKTIKKMTSSKKVHEAKKSSSGTKEISGSLSNGTVYEATAFEDGFVISFDPFMARKDDLFMQSSIQIIAKLYSDQLKDEAHISIESDIDYTIITGLKGRYKIVPYKESSGEISSLSISQI